MDASCVPLLQRRGNSALSGLSMGTWRCANLSCSRYSTEEGPHVPVIRHVKAEATQGQLGYIVKSQKPVSEKMFSRHEPYTPQNVAFACVNVGTHV